MAILVLSETAKVLGINTYTLEALANNGSIPCTHVNNQLRFDTIVIMDWMQTNPKISFSKDPTVSIAKQIQHMFPEVLNNLKIIDARFSPERTPKLYYLSKVKSKKHGFLYYVRYMVKGKLIPSRWNTHTNILKAAELYAEENREKLLQKYYERKNPKYAKCSIYHILSTYYDKHSELFLEAEERGRALTDSVRITYHNFINGRFIPFLKDNKIEKYEDITPPLLANFQTYLLRKNLTPYTINRRFGAIRAIFDHLIMRGIIIENVINKVTGLNEKKSKKKRKKTRGGCYEISLLYGIFNRQWKEEKEYLLNLLIHTTDIRNNEIENITPDDIFKIKNCFFINIKGREIHGEQISKSVNGIRIVPLHPFVHNKIYNYIMKNNFTNDDIIFPFKSGSYIYNKANTLLCEKLAAKLNIKKSEVKDYLEKEAITFYSGRHYWKTLMNSKNLGDAEEYFMGHKITADVAKIYNHRDKQGQAILVQKAREIFKILDSTLLKKASLKKERKSIIKKPASRKKILVEKPKIKSA